MFWLLNLLRKRPEGLLTLLARAHHIDTTQASCSAAFRAGLKVGLDHPEIGRALRERNDPEWTI